MAYSDHTHLPVSRVVCDSGAPFTFLGRPFGVPRRIEDDTVSNSDSLPDLVTDPGWDCASSEASSALTTRPPLDLCFPGTCDVNFAPNVVDRLLGTRLFLVSPSLLTFKVATAPFVIFIKGLWGQQPFNLLLPLTTTWLFTRSSTVSRAFESAKLSPSGRAVFLTRSRL